MPYVGHYGDLFAIVAKKRIAYRLRRVVGYAKGQHRYAAYEEITPALEYTYAFRRHLAYQRLHGLPCSGVGVYRYAVTPAKHADARYVVCMLMGDEYGGYVIDSFPRKGKGSRYGAGAFARAKYITIPAMRPIIAPAVIITVFTTFKQFDVVYLLTQQAGAKTGSGFHTILTYAYENAFITNNYGYSSAISMIIFALLLLFSAKFQLKEDA